MKFASLLAAFLVGLIATAAASQPLAPDGVDVVLARAAVCAPPDDARPDFDAIAARVAELGWPELSRREALRLQAIPDKKAVVRAWRAGAQALPSYLLVQTSPTPRPRQLICEAIFEGPDSAAVQSRMADGAFGERLGPPTLQGPLPQGGRFVEWAAPADSGWRRVNYSVPVPPKKGSWLHRIRFTGVEN